MRPTERTIFLFGAGIGLALLVALAPEFLWAVWLTYVALLSLALALDALWLAPARRIEVSVEIPDTLFVGDRDPMEVRVRSLASRPTQLEFVCDLDPELHAQPVHKLTLPAHGTVRFEFQLVPKRRGRLHVVALWWRWQGPLGLMRKKVRRNLDRTIAVVPNVRAVRQAALRLHVSQELLAGTKVQRFIGQGSEFESLREYTPGLDHRSMDWKASARHRKLLCQERRDERNHYVVVAVDSGRLMREPLAGIPKLDHAVNAALLLAYLSVRAGDQVGLYAFDEKARNYVAPAPGLAAYRRLQQATADLEYTDAETNFTLSLAELSRQLRRRTFVVVMTDFVDTITAELMLENLERLARRHLVVFVALRDPQLQRMTRARPASLERLYQAVTAGDFLKEREVVIHKLQRLGIHCIDTTPAKMSVELVNHYLEVKRRGAL